MGGCDSRLNLGNTDNRGLEGFVREMNDIYNNIRGVSSSLFMQTLSRPDFWALVQIRALAWGIRNGGSVPSLGSSFVHYQYGRFNTTEDSTYDDI